MLLQVDRAEARRAISIVSLSDEAEAAAKSMPVKGGNPDHRSGEWSGLSMRKLGVVKSPGHGLTQ